MINVYRDDSVIYARRSKDFKIAFKERILWKK